MIEDNKIIIGVYIRTFSIYNEFGKFHNNYIQFILLYYSKLILL